MSFFVASAMAQDAAPPPQAGGTSSLIMLVVFGLIFYFLLWRPQSKRAKQHREMVAALEKGDEVITNGGLTGRVTKVADDFVAMEIAEGVEVKMQKSAVSSVLPKGTLKSIDK